MRKLTLCEHISLDGVVQHSADENNFPYADWTTPYRSAAGRDALLAAQGDTYDLLLGRRTYDLWSTFWPNAPAGNAWADGINAATKYVVTHHPDTLEWGPHQALGPDLLADIQTLKASAGPPLVLWGSSTLTSPLLLHGLVDELLLVVYPILLGTGKRLFAEGTPPRAFQLLTSQSTPTGALVNTYKPTGPLKTA